MNDYQELWNKITLLLKNELDETTFDEIFKESNKVFKYENDYLYVIVPNSLVKFRIEQFYLSSIKNLSQNLSPLVLGFKFITKKDAEDEIIQKKETPTKLTEIDNLSSARNLSSLYRFNNFEVGESNRYAFLTATKVAENGVKFCNPLYIFGDVGLGKTHLMQAIGNYILDKNIKANVVYVGAQSFFNEYFLATSPKNGRERMESFYIKYNSADYLLVDDVQLLEGKPTTQEEFFKIFEHLTNTNKQIVLTSDRPANTLKLMPRLRSRFNWGVSVDIKQPDFTLLMNILRNKLSILIEEPSDVSDEVLKILADSFPSNIRDLEGALRTFITYCICMNCPFTKENLYLSLDRMLPKNTEKTDSSLYIIEKSIETICKYFKVSKTDLISTSRKQQVAYARQMLMYILRTEFNLPLQVIGSSLGSRDHATVAHGVDKITTQIKSNQLVKNDYMILLKTIK